VDARARVGPDRCAVERKNDRSLKMSGPAHAVKASIANDNATAKDASDVRRKPTIDEDSELTDVRLARRSTQAAIHSRLAILGEIQDSSYD